MASDSEITGRQFRVPKDNQVHIESIRHHHPWTTPSSDLFDKKKKKARRKYWLSLKMKLEWVRECVPIRRECVQKTPSDRLGVSLLRPFWLLLINVLWFHARNDAIVILDRLSPPTNLVSDEVTHFMKDSLLPYCDPITCDLRLYSEPLLKAFSEIDNFLWSRWLDKDFINIEARSNSIEHARRKVLLSAEPFKLNNFPSRTQLTTKTVKIEKIKVQLCALNLHTTTPCARVVRN